MSHKKANKIKGIECKSVACDISDKFFSYLYINIFYNRKYTQMRKMCKKSKNICENTCIHAYLCYNETMAEVR